MLACRPMLSLALAVIAGVLAARFFPGLSSVLPYGWALFVAFALWVLLLRRTTPPAVPARLPPEYARHIMPTPGLLARRGLNVCILLLCLACFLFAVQRQEGWRLRLSRDNLPDKRFFTAVLLVDGPMRRHADEEGRVRVAVRLMLADGREAGKIPLRFHTSPGETFQRGDLVHARIQVAIPPVKSHPGAFDARFWLERDGLVASAYAVRPIKADSFDYPYSVLPVASPPVRVRLMRVVDGVRSRAIAATLRHGGGHGPMLAAMLYGYRDDMDRELNASFRRVGIGHVLAISGLHVGLVVSMLWWLGGRVAWPVRWRAFSCLALAFVYLGLSGGQVAAARATLMAAIYLAGIIWGRKSDMLNSLGAAAFFIVLHNPTAPADVSFQLSFTAVVFIFIGVRGRPWKRAKERDAKRPVLEGRVLLFHRLRASADSLVRLSVATWIGLFPIIALVFHQVNLVGLPINVVVIPWMGVVLACGLLLPVLGWIPGAGYLLTLPSAALVEAAAFSDRLPWSSFPAHAPDGWWVAAFYAFVFLYLLHGMLGSERARRVWLLLCPAGLAVTLTGLVFSMASADPPAEGRIAWLPGRDFGVLVAETAAGGIALVGQFRGDGLDEASWLHALKRSGGVSVVELGNRGPERLKSLAYHYPVDGYSGVALVESARFCSTGDVIAGEFSGWSIPDSAPGVEYAYFRNARGRLIAVAVRCENKAILSMGFSARIEDAELAGLILEHECADRNEIFISLASPAADIVERLQTLLPAARIGSRGTRRGKADGLIALESTGTVVLGETALVYDGARWLPLGEPGSR